MIEIKISEPIDLRGFTFIEGFPGIGLVGPMAISYIIDKMKMDYVGYIDSDAFPPLVSIHNNVPMPPIRVYASKKSKIFTILAEFAIPLEQMHELSGKIFDFIKQSGISKIVSISGVPTAKYDENGPVFAIGSSDAVSKEIQKAGLKAVGEGVATGVSALLLLASVDSDIPDYNILVPVDPAMVNPKYAETAITAINRLLKLNIDIDELDKEAKEVEAKIKDILKRHKEAQDASRKTTEEAGPPTYV